MKVPPSKTLKAGLSKWNGMAVIIVGSDHDPGGRNSRKYGTDHDPPAPARPGLAADSTVGVPGPAAHTGWKESYLTKLVNRRELRESGRDRTAIISSQCDPTPVTSHCGRDTRVSVTVTARKLSGSPRCPARPSAVP
eukprot:766155-Hanusia_phi.AAC.4